MKKLNKQIKTWIFDLDNTLYSADSGVFQQVHDLMGKFVSNHLNIDIEEAKKMGIKADGPLPCDTSFITAFKNKNHDCIVGMYHDALQCGLKAFGFDRGVTVSGGLDIPITTPAHGTAFDIAGTNKANLEPTLQSFKIALTMAENKFKE